MTGSDAGGAGAPGDGGEGGGGGPPGWGADDLPLIGEPAPVELANSLYGAGDERVDFLGTPALARLWLAHAALPVPFPARLARADADRLRTLRDAVRRLVDQAVDGVTPSPAAVAVLNREARRAPRAPRLVIAPPAPADAGPAPVGAFRLGWTSPARGADAALGALAHEAIALFGGPDADRLRRCAAPDCAMAFVQHHRRRRWCHDSCGHRMRQAAYHRRRSQRPASPAAASAPATPAGTSGSAARSAGAVAGVDRSTGEGP